LKTRTAELPTSTASLEKPSTVEDNVNRFRLGWRDVARLGENGQIEWERMPLTAYDILHPKEGDHQVHTTEHKAFCVYLDNVLSAQVAHDPHAVVMHDTGVRWDKPGLLWHSPDVALIYGVREIKKWGMFDVAEEGTRPSLIIEITSPETRMIDLVDKADQYERAGVAYYVIVDAYISKRHPAYELIGYELTPDGYVELAPNERGWLWLEPAQIWLGLNGNRLECYDRQGGLIENYVDVAEARKFAELRIEHAEAHAEAETRRAEEATQRAEAEVRRAEEATQRAEAEVRRAEEATQRAEAEAQARQALQERLRALEAEMRRVRGEDVR
jgi:colicin import membrane protein